MRFAHIAISVCLTLGLAWGAAPAGAADGKALIVQGNQAAARGEFARAVRLYTKAIDAGGLSKANLAVAYMNRGSARDDSGRTDQAIADFTRALEHDPGLDLAHYNRSFAYEKKGLIQLAAADMEKAVRLNSDDKDYQDRLAYLNQRLAGGPVIGGARP